MSIVLKSGDSSDELKVDGTSKAVRATLYTPNGDSCMDETNNAINVSLVSGSITANTQIDLNKIGGNTVNAGTGVVGTGTLRVVLATDQAQLTNALKVDGSAVTQPISGTVSVSGTVTVSGTVSVSGTVTVSGAVTVSGTVTASNTAGDVASDGVDSGNPVKIGGVARTTDITAVSSADRVNWTMDTLGKGVVLVGATHEFRVIGTVNLTNNSASDVIAAVSGRKIVITGGWYTNASATVSTKVTIRDGTTTKLVGYAALGGGGAVLTNGPVFVGTTNTAVTAICGTTGADVDITLWGYTISN